MCTGKPKSMCDSLYCNMWLITRVWSRACSISQVCLYEENILRCQLWFSFSCGIMGHLFHSSFFAIVSRKKWERLNEYFWWRKQTSPPGRTGAAFPGSRRKGVSAHASLMCASGDPWQSSSLLTPGQWRPLQRRKIDTQLVMTILKLQANKYPKP